jgi:L-fuconolactonase
MAERPAMTEVVDAHLHFWDPAKFDYPWLAAEPALRRRFGPDDLAGSEAGSEVSAVVFIEADRLPGQAEQEIEWVEELARGWPPLRAAVAHADLERGAGVAADLRRLAMRPLVRGVRRNLQDEEPGFALRPGFVEATRLLAEHGFTADICVRPHQLPAVLGLAMLVPEVTFVLDHLGKPAVGDGRDDAWPDHLRRLAGRPNVLCKLSGLPAAGAQPFLRLALAEFGADRCLVGSDWPLAPYRRSFDLVVEALRDRTARERDHVLRGTALRTYRISSGTDGH